MKKSIGIIAAVVLSTSLYSQNYDPAKPHQSSTSAARSDSSSQSSSSRSSESSTGSAEFDAQSSFRAQQDENKDGAAKQGTSLSDREAAQTLRNSDDPDLANRNQEQGLTNPDRTLNSVDDQEPDMIYEEWILITPEDVGGPSEFDSGSSSSSKQPAVQSNRSATGELDNNDPENQFNRETSDLNESRIYNGSDYSHDYVGGPAQSESGTLRSQSNYDDKDCEVDHQRSVDSSGTAIDHDERLNLERESNVGGPAESQTESRSSREWDDQSDSTVPSSGSEINHDERYRTNRSESDGRYHINRDESSSLDNYRGADESNTDNSNNNGSDDSTVDSSRSSDLNSQESTSDSNTIPPDL